MNNIIQRCITRRKIMELFLKYPKREFTVNELSKLSFTSYATTWRFIQMLDKAGVIFTKSIGHSLICKLNKDSPFLREIKKALELKPSPQKAVIEDFINKIKEVEDVQKIVLFGSVSKGMEDLTSDIDIAVFVNRRNKKLEEEINKISNNIIEKSKMKLVPLILTPRELKKNKQFAIELEKGIVLYERIERS
jgi:predicted nucleotidyltransferase